MRSITHLGVIGGGLTQVAANQPDRFAPLVRKHQGMVFSIAYHWLGNHALAEEIAQDVFLDLFQKLDAMESDEHISRYLRRVTAHRLIDLSRARARKPQVPLESVREPASDEATSDPLMDGRLRRLLATLPEQTRLMVILRYQEDLTVPEIADALGVPQPTVKSRLHRTLLWMRGRLAGDRASRRTQ